MCNLYLITKGQAAIQKFTRAMRDRAGNLPPLMGVYPDQPAPVVRNGEDGERELTMMLWGMSSPQSDSQDRTIDSGVTMVHDVTSPHWRGWLGPENRCVVPFTSFSELKTTAENKKVPVWFARDKSRPLMVFAGIWTNWTGVRKAKEGEVNADLYALLTCELKDVAAPIHLKAKPAILTEPEEIDVWMRAEWSEAARCSDRCRMRRFRSWRGESGRTRRRRTKQTSTLAVRHHGRVSGPSRLSYPASAIS